MSFCWRLGGVTSGVLRAGEIPARGPLSGGGSAQARQRGTAACWLLLLPELGGQPRAEPQGPRSQGHQGARVSPASPSCVAGASSRPAAATEGARGWISPDGNSTWARGRGCVGSMNDDRRVRYGQRAGRRGGRGRFRVGWGAAGRRWQALGCRASARCAHGRERPSERHWSRVPQCPCLQQWK